MLVVSHDLIGAARVAHRQGRAMQCDFIELVCQPSPRTHSTEPLEPFPKGLSDGLGFGLPGQFGERVRELFRLCSAA